MDPPKRNTNQKAAETQLSSSATPTVNVVSLDILFSHNENQTATHVGSEGSSRFLTCWLRVRWAGGRGGQLTLWRLTQSSLVIVLLLRGGWRTTGAALWSSGLLLLPSSSWDPQGDGQLGVLRGSTVSEMWHWISKTVCQRVMVASYTYYTYCTALLLTGEISVSCFSCVVGGYERKKSLLENSFDHEYIVS